MTDTAKHTLYICYFGLRQPLVETQVIPYLQEIAKGGITVSLLTFEPDLKNTWTADEIGTMRKLLAERNIAWYCLAYHKRPSALATAYDIFAGARFVRRKIREGNLDILHGRVHVATLMGAIARKFSSRKPKLIFDIRGFFPEEYTDAGVWMENGLLYRAAKRVEKWLMRESDGFVVLTERAREILFPVTTPKSKIQNPKSVVEVIPCCVDLQKRFQLLNPTSREEMRGKLGARHRFVVAHIGALGGLYLTEEIVHFLDAARRLDPKTYALFLTQTDPNEVVSLLKDHGFAESDHFVAQVDPAEIPKYLSAADVGLSFVKATYATQSRSPTKIPEYLAAGLPIIANSGVGDVDELIESEGVGVLIDRFDREAYLGAFERLTALGDVSEKCRETAKRRFDLEKIGGVRYRRLYEHLFCNDGD